MSLFNTSEEEDGGITVSSSTSSDTTSEDVNATYLIPTFPNEQDEKDGEDCGVLTLFHSGDFSPFSPTTSAILIFYLAFGIVCSYLGYRVFKALMFWIGFIFGSLVIYCICLEDAQNFLPDWSNALISLSAGILFGLITLLVQYVGLFMLGFHTGLLHAVIGLVFVQTVLGIVPSTPWISIGLLLASGLLCAILNLYFQKSLSIYGSALYGGAIVAVVLDYFIENSTMIMWVWDKIRIAPPPYPDQCWFSWILLSVWPFISITGLVSQILVTGKDIYHEEQFPPRRNNNSKNNRSTNRESREERKQRKYRYLYQVRTCHGDVISQPISKKYVHQVNDESF